jgi:hypothetical protein
LAKNDQNLIYVKDFVKFFHAAADPKGSKRLYIYWEEADPTLGVYRKIDSEIENKSFSKRVKRSGATKTNNKNKAIKQKPEIKQEIKQKSEIK